MSYWDAGFQFADTVDCHAKYVAFNSRAAAIRWRRCINFRTKEVVVFESREKARRAALNMPPFGFKRARVIQILPGEVNQ